MKSHENLTRKTDPLHKWLCTPTVGSRCILLRMRNVSDKSCRENQITVLCTIFFINIVQLMSETRDNNIIQRRKDKICMLDN